LGLYENLSVFKASYDLLLNIYQCTGNFTHESKYTLTEKVRNETMDLMLLIHWTGKNKKRNYVG